MELILLDRDFQPVAFPDAFDSLIWDRRYYETGRFELHLPGALFPVLQQSAYLYGKDFAETGVIEDLGFSQEAGGEKCYAKGRFLDALLEQRVITGTGSLRGSAESVMRDFVTLYAINGRHPIPSLYLGAACGGTDSIEVQAVGESLLERLYQIAQSQELSIRMRYSHVDAELYFDIWRGVDRTADQSANPRAVFSDAFENVTTSSYTCSRSDYKNFAYVAGENAAGAQVLVQVDHSERGERREVWIDAKDIKQEEGMTSAQYSAALKQRGEEKLAEYVVAESVEAAVSTVGNLVYGVDYDLGDKCTYQNHRLGVACDLRITGITETYENNTRTVEITFGSEEKTILKKIKRGV